MHVCLRRCVVAVVAFGVIGVSGCLQRRITLDECRPCFSGAPPQSYACRHCYEIRARRPGDLSPDALDRAYHEEYRYIDVRRRSLASAPKEGAEGASTKPAVPAALIGVALSGGGIRSASFNLGALQALERTGVWDQLDYMSGVSGGGYVAGWVQAHLGQAKSFLRDEYHYAVRAETPADLFRNHGDHVEQLRTHTGFLNEGGWFEGPRVFGDWLWRWPFHLVLDDVLHLRGWFNFQHVLNVYRHRIEKTYLRGTPAEGVAADPIWALPLEDVNAPEQAKATPYFVLNGNLTNRGESQIGVPCWNFPGPGEHQCDQWNFEYTRDFVGSDATGYVDTHGYGLRVDEVLRDGETPKAVLIQHHPDEDSATRRLLDRIGVAGIHRYALSEAMAASGAAFDSAAIAYELNVPVVNEIGQLLVGGLLNLYLGAETPNFARREPAGAFLDYAAMMTFQRWAGLVNPGARWLYVTDGGHYDNLGVLSLLRRGVKCVVAFDATADPDRRYEDLDTLRRRVTEDLGMQMIQPTDFPTDGNDPAAHYRFLVKQGGKTVAVVLYVKSGADERLQHMQPGNSHALALHHLEQWYRREDARATADARTRLRRLYAELRDGDGRVAGELQARTERIDRLRACRRDVLASREPDNDADPATSCAGVVASEPELQPTCGATLQSDDCVAALQMRIDAIELEVRHLAVDEDYEVAQLERSLDEALPDENRDAEIVRMRSELREAPRHDKDRADRIEKVLSYARTKGSKGTFPHDSTLREWYDWERFDAYRMLGFEEAVTYLERFDPSDPGASGDDLPWCRFAWVPPPAGTTVPAAVQQQPPRTPSPSTF